MLNSVVVELADDATAHDAVTDDEVTDDALTDDALTDDAVMAALFSFLMHLMGLDSISHTIAMLLVGSIVFEAVSFVFVAFCAHFCS